ncbi:MAG: glycosyltransferase family 4 protein [Cyclobacteriaceae bacterium]|nr:glycosyltransferase family 4 protein [Cyclobacteriaceae bacterium]
MGHPLTIGFLSFEFPVETGGGGIGTYLLQTLRVCPDDCRMVVIAGTRQPEPFWESDQVFRFPCSNWQEYNERLPQHFDALHAQLHFDLVEGTDFRAGGLPVRRSHPEIPFVVKLHTPSFLIDTLQYQPLSGWSRWRWTISHWLRGRHQPQPKGPQRAAYADEFDILAAADALHATSKSIATKLASLGMITQAQAAAAPVFPYNYNLSAFLGIPDADMEQSPVVTFVGRKEIRKGVIEFAKVVDVLASEFPHVTFRFIGNATAGLHAGETMDDHLRNLVGGFANVEISPAIPYDQVRTVYATSSILVFPSHYESFGLVCAEAMAAGRAIIGSRRGGMADMIVHERDGLLIDPFDHHAFTESVRRLITDINLRRTLGLQARSRAIDYFSPANTIDRQMKLYRELIHRHEQKSQSA